jgi:hypothetical protein
MEVLKLTDLFLELVSTDIKLSKVLKHTYLRQFCGSLARKFETNMAERVLNFPQTVDIISRHGVT